MRPAIALAVFFAISLGFANLPAGRAEPAAAATQDSTCTDLAGVDLAQLEDAPTIIAEGKVMPATKPADPARCSVRGLIAPGITFDLEMPLSDWNGKILEIGCVGMCGSLLTITWCDAPLRRGYACVTTDMGHSSTPDDALWTFGDARAQADFGYRATHVGLLAARAIALRFYGREPARAYLYGCSTGGYQGLVEAQKYPWDFDGIVAVAPDVNETDLALTTIWTSRALTRSDGRPVLSDNDLQLLHAAAAKVCGRNNRERNDLVGDPHTCNFDPRALICAGKTNCLTPEQADAARKVYAGPSNSVGEPITYSGGYEPGSELNWNDANVSAKPSNWALDMLRYAFFSPPPGAVLRQRDIDFDKDYKRLGGAVGFTDVDPDLRRFKASGGKLIIAQGWADQYEPPMGAVNYYETVERTMGGRAATQDFFRLFMVPDMWHCTGGPGAFAVDYLGYLDAWVEHGAAPDSLVAAHVPNLAWGQAFGLQYPLAATTTIDFSRPLYPYPLRAIYLGAGDPNRLESYRPR